MPKVDPRQLVLIPDAAGEGETSYVVRCGDAHLGRIDFVGARWETRDPIGFNKQQFASPGEAAMHLVKVYNEGQE